MVALVIDFLMVVALMVVARTQFLLFWSGVQILYLNWSVKNNGENLVNSTQFRIFLDDNEGNTSLNMMINIHHFDNILYSYP